MTDKMPRPKNPYGKESDYSSSVFDMGASRQRELLASEGWRKPRVPIVCLCGSTKFSEAFQKAQLEETLAGKIVLTIGCNMRTDDEIFRGMSDEQRRKIKDRLDELHLMKIEIADEVLILNVGGYIGESTAREIEYAKQQGKPIQYLEHFESGY